MWKQYIAALTLTFMGSMACLSVASGAKPAPSATSLPPQAQTTGQSGDTDPNADLRLQLALLRQQNAIVKGGQADLLQTVYFSLGTVVLLALALIGYGWWTNFRMYERDKETLTKELTATVTAHRNNIKETLIALESTLNTKLSSAESALDTKLTSLETSLTHKLTLVEYDLADLESDFRLEAESPSAAVTSAIKQLGLVIRLNSGWRARYAMESIERAIENKGEFLKGEVSKTLQLLEKVPQLSKVEPEVIEQARALATKVRAARIFQEKSE